MESADRNGSALRRLLRMADRFKDAAILLGSRCLKTPCSSLSALLVCVTREDQYRRDRVFRRRLGPCGVLRLVLPVLAAAFAVRAIASTPPIGSCARPMPCALSTANRVCGQLFLATPLHARGILLMS